MMIMVHTTHHFFDSVVIANLRASLASNTSTSFYRTQVCHRIASAMVPDLPALSSLSKSWHNQQPDAKRFQIWQNIPQGQLYEDGYDAAEC